MKKLSLTQPTVLNGPPITTVYNPDYNAGNDQFGQSILIDTVHDGDYYPESLAQHFRDPVIQKVYETEKDWGANQIAFELMRKLNLESFQKVEIVRALMDFNRFSGSTTADIRNHMDRRAINSPFSETLQYDEKKEVLAAYDQVSARFDALIPKTTLKLAIHTYDKYNPSVTISDRTIRPLTSIIYRSFAYQNNMRMPFGLFDKLYIDELGEFTADRKLVARLSLTLEKERIPMGQNHPYALPEGSVELRAQVWHYFHFLQEQYQHIFPDTVADIPHQNVWTMLMDTNFRNGDSDIFRSYIHMYRRAPAGYEQICEDVKNAYYAIKEYADNNREPLLEKYRWNPKRLNAVVFEARKDFVWDFNLKRPKLDNIDRLTDLLAQGITRYYERDL